MSDPVAVRFAASLGIAAALVSAIAFSTAVLRVAPILATTRPDAGSDCTAPISRTLAPASILQCETSTVTLTVRPACPHEAVNIAFIIAQHGTEDNWRTARDYQQAAARAVGDAKNPNFKGSVVVLGNRAQLAVPLTADRAKIMKALLPPRNNVPVTYGTAFMLALKSLDEGAGARRAVNAVAYLGYGYGQGTPQDIQDWLRATDRAKSSGATLILGCPWNQPSCDTALGANMCDESSPGWCAQGYSQSGRFGSLISRFIGSAHSIEIKTLDVEETLPPGLTYVPDSSSPAPPLVDPATGRVRWTFTSPITEAYTITYKVQPEIVSTFAFTRGLTTFADSLNRPGGAVAPASALTVTGLCPLPTPTSTATPTDTSTPTASSTASATPLATSTPSATVTPSATSTSVPAPVFLPLLLREKCTPEQRRVDAVIVLDASQSMLEPSAPGSAQTKLDVSRAAARTFLDALRLDQGDQAAVIAFNSQAMLLTDLTASRPALDAALASIVASPQTCIVCGIDAGATELASPHHKADHAPVLILLTDGRSSPQPASAAVERAAQARAAGIRIYTIGLGAELDEAALREMASDASSYFHAPSGEELAGIYREIAVDIPCPVGTFWGGR